MPKFFVLISLLTSTVVLRAQGLQESYRLGCELFDLGDLEGASALLNRVAYFDQEGIYKSDCYYKLARTHLDLQEFGMAFKYYEMSIISCSDLDRANDLILEKSVELIKRKQFLNALQELYSLYDLNPQQQRLNDYLTATALYGNGEYVEAEKYFLTLVETKSDSLLIDNIFAKIDKKLDPRRPGRARNMSYILPGLGQIYAGNIRNSVNSMVLIGAIGVLYFSTVAEYGLISGIITVLPWLSRYHVGGAENAKRAMEERQEKLKSKYYDQLLLQVRT